MQEILSIDGFITGLVAITFGLIILFKDRKNIINITLFLTTLATAFWAFAYWRWLSVYDDKETALFWCRVLSIGSDFIPVFYFHWITSLLNLNKKLKPAIIIAYILAFVSLLFSFSPIYVKNVASYPPYFSFWPQAGILYTLNLFIVYGGLVTWAIILLFKHHKKSTGLKRIQIKYVLLGSLFGFAGGATNFPLWYNIPVLPFGNFLVILYPIIFSYAIIQHRLMDIKLALRKSTVYLSSLFTLTLLITAIKYAYAVFFGQNNIWIDIFIILIIILFYNSIKNYYYKIANKYFFTSLYDSRKLIEELSDKLKSSLNLEKIYYSIYDSLLKAMHIKSFGILKYNSADKSYGVEYNKGFAIGETKRFAGNEKLHQLFIAQNKPIVVDEFAHTKNETIKNTINMLKKLRVGALIPLGLKNKNIGLLALGEKESKDMFNNEDLRVLKIIGTQAAMAIENALSYEKILDFNIKLKKSDKIKGDLVQKLNNKVAELEASKKIISEEREKTTAILANFSDPIIVLNEKNKITFFNPEAKRILGLELSDLGREISEKDDFSLENFRNIIKNNYSFKKIKSSAKKNISLEEFTLDFKNEKLNYKIITAKIKGKKGEYLGIMKIFYDVTREKMIDKMKSDFVTIAAHQLRTPLSAIKWAIKIVLDGDTGKITKEQKAILDKGYQSNERVIRLINDLLDVTRIEEGKFGYEFELNSFDQVIDSSIKTLDKNIKDKHIHFLMDRPKTMPDIYMDKQKITLAFQNIMENAAKYTPEYGTIKIKIKKIKNSLQITVADNGVGIPKQEQGKLFSKFFRASNVMGLETEGNGLDLFIVKNIIEKHGGNIKIKSEEGKGTNVIFTLPIKQKPQA